MGPAPIKPEVEKLIGQKIEVEKVLEVIHGQGEQKPLF